MNTQLPQRYADRASVNTIREVFDYINRYKDKTFVLKIEDSLINHALFPLLMRDIVQLHDIGIHLIIVAGTRATIERYLARANISTRVINGTRITPLAAMPHAKLAAMAVVQAIISHLSSENTSGIMGNWIRARSLGVCEGVDYEYTGKVEKIQSHIIDKLLSQNFIPVIYNIGMNGTGDCYNLNSDQIAQQICLDLDIEKLFFIRAQDAIPATGLDLPPGSQVHPNGDIFSNMDLGHVDFMLTQGKDHLSLENQTLLACSKTVIDRPKGVNRVTLEDVPEILHLVDGYVKKGNLVRRTASDIKNRITAYHIYAVDHAIYGCAALYEIGDGWAEIGAVAVNDAYKSKGIGRGLLQYLIQTAQAKQIKTLFLLTTQAADWFFEFGFVWASPSKLPSSRRQEYNLERNSRVLLLNL